MAQRSAPGKAKEDRRVGAIFARRMREARDARGWTQQDLADELDRLEAPMDRTTLAKLEKGRREVRLDELVAIAAALDVAIVHLILPIEGDVAVHTVDDEGVGHGHGMRGPRVWLTPALGVQQVKARRWARGELPLRPASFRFYRDQTAGDLLVSAEELSPTAQQALHEENEQLLRKLGVQIVHEPAEQSAAPTKRGRVRPAGKESR